MENYSATKKKWDIDVCHNMDELLNYYSEWKKADKKSVYYMIPHI